jgi:hypothetical protein
VTALINSVAVNAKIVWIISAAENPGNVALAK